MNSDISFNDILAKLRAMDRRLQAAAIVCALLLVYFGVLGMQIRSEVQRNSGYLTQQQTLMRTINAAARIQQSPEVELAAAEAEMNEITARLSLGHIDEIYPLVADVASRSRVSLTGGITSAAGGTQSREGMTYDVHKVSVRINGSLGNIRGFIEEMSRTTAVAVTSLSINGLGGSPSANLEMSLFLNPRPATGAK